MTLLISMTCARGCVWVMERVGIIFRTYRTPACARGVILIADDSRPPAHFSPDHTRQDKQGLTSHPLHHHAQDEEDDDKEKKQKVPKAGAVVAVALLALATTDSTRQAHGTKPYVQQSRGGCPRSPTTVMARHYCIPLLLQLLFLTILVLLPSSSAWVSTYPLDPWGSPAFPHSPLSTLLPSCTPSQKFGGGSKSKTTSSSSNPRSSTSSNPSLQALDQELVELADLIRLQTEKLRVLEAYRRQVTAGVVEKKGGDSATSQCAAPVFTPSPLSLSSGSIDGGSTSSALAEDYLVRLAALPATGGVNEGVASAETGENGRVTALKMLTFQRVRDKAAPRGSHMQNSKAMNVLVVARADTGATKDEKNKKKLSAGSTTSTSSGRAPWLSFYDMQGQLLGQYVPPGHASAAITTLAFEAVGGEDALLVTGGRDGSLSLHNVQLWKDGKIVAGRGPPASSVSSSSPSSFVVPPNVTSSDGFGIQVVHEASLLSSNAHTKKEIAPVVPAAATATAAAATNAGSPVLSALLYQHRGLGWMVFSGDVAGNIHCHFRNGTSFKVKPKG